MTVFDFRRTRLFAITASFGVVGACSVVALGSSRPSEGQAHLQHRTAHVATSSKRSVKHAAVRHTTAAATFSDEMIDPNLMSAEARVAPLTTLPKNVARLFASGPYAGANHSAVRLLVTHLGAMDRSIISFQGPDGSQCHALADTSILCEIPSADPAPLRKLSQIGYFVSGGVDASASLSGQDLPASIWGPVPDGIASVQFVVNGANVPAVMQNNAMFFEVPAGAQLTDVTQMMITSTSGATVAVPFDGNLRPS